ncbi:FtsK/SpoIIIE domain-containing protein [Microbacterium sp. ASV81]|uniref:FtsK/SpoIIIE domain-containing protein n=1 Tax=Microbacterium capsulatum TaxID=3041921 RepID=A0ABU0XF98_9MICO|nr:FtsK/SpoIIIE domain-containing protein [Microbacterium sp. ASV81]MDQ4212360.1 FtsK/SpoIIIE domain-containing protein [Microbacterium sp. ASV81]
MDPAEPIVLPPTAVPPQRAPLPLLAAVVPVASGVVLFAVTGSALSLCFAALGPLMILASFLDGLRQRRRATRIARAEETGAWARVAETVAERADAERTRLRRLAPDLAGCLAEPPLRRTALPAGVPVTIGRGDAPSPLRFSGVGPRADEFRARHRSLSGVPVTAELTHGVCLRGPEPIATAVARGLVLQLCLRHTGTAVRFDGDGLVRLGLEGLPQARGGARRAETVHVGAERPASSGARLALVSAGSPPPSGYDTVVDLVDPVAAAVRTPDGERICAVEGISGAQAAALVRDLAENGDDEAEVPTAVGLAEVVDGTAIVTGDGTEDAGRGGLRVAVGRDAIGPVVVDLVADGPHALVTGVTGAGKSELLVSWIAALAAAHPADRVAFVLADFKGGTAFEPLRALPHVAAVMTDLDADGAERGVRSMRAELRRREGVLSEHGARSIAEAGGALGRLVIVVDEFAVLLQEHPELAAVFSDIAARGRALGMHLILGTQRATGVIRDAIATNCPLRISLRVTDPADSRAMVGTDEAASLPGDAAGRGLALVRRPQDAGPALFRVARTSTEDLARIVAAAAGQQRARSPWQPALPLHLRRTELAAVPRGEIVLGLADEPERQRRCVRTLRVGEQRGLMVLGGPGSGKSAVLCALAEQVPEAVRVPQDPEQAWSLVDAIAEGLTPMPPLLVVDDVDRILAAFPIEYASAWAERLQRVVRAAGERAGTVLLSASRCAGPVAALADLLPSRAVLRTTGRTEHLAAGGEPRSFDPERPPGRATLDGAQVQFTLPESDERPPGPVSAPTPVWAARAPLVGVVSTAPARTADLLARGVDGARVSSIDDGAPVTLPDGIGSGQVGPERILLVGDADAWQRQYALWQRIARAGEILVLAEAARELRTLARVRELPPYAAPHAGRAWTIDPDGRPSRVVLPAPRGGVSRAARPEG